MSKVKITTNNHWREFIGFWEINNPNIQDGLECDYNYLDDIESEYFICYRDRWYHLSDFMSLHNKIHCPNPPDLMNGWDGYLNDSFFSGVLIKVSECGEGYQIATFY